MGHFNEQGRYELTFDEYDSIEEAAEKMIDAYRNATAANQKKIYISLGKIPTTAELQSHMEIIRDLPTSLPYLLLYYRYIPQYLETCEDPEQQSLYRAALEYIDSFLKENLVLYDAEE